MNKLYFFHKEDNDFTEILSDKTLMKHVSTRFTYDQTLILGFGDSFREHEKGYLILKYGDLLKNPIVNRTPVPWVDYQPIKRLKR